MNLPDDGNSASAASPSGTDFAGSQPVYYQYGNSTIRYQLVLSPEGVVFPEMSFVVPSGAAGPVQPGTGTYAENTQRPAASTELPPRAPMNALGATGSPGQKAPLQTQEKKQVTEDPLMNLKQAATTSTNSQSPSTEAAKSNKACIKSSLASSSNTSELTVNIKCADSTETTTAKNLKAPPTTLADKKPSPKKDFADTNQAKNESPPEPTKYRRSRRCKRSISQVSAVVDDPAKRQRTGTQRSQTAKRSTRSQASLEKKPLVSKIPEGLARKVASKSSKIVRKIVRKKNRKKPPASKPSAPVPAKKRVPRRAAPHSTKDGRTQALETGTSILPPKPSELGASETKSTNAATQFTQSRGFPAARVLSASMYPSWKKNIILGTPNQPADWELTEVASTTTIRVAGAPTCATSGCDLAACCCYENSKNGLMWICCLDCQITAFGGWPSEEKLGKLGVLFMSDTHKKHLIHYSSYQNEHLMPILEKSKPVSMALFKYNQKLQKNGRYLTRNTKPQAVEAIPIMKEKVLDKNEKDGNLTSIKNKSDDDTEAQISPKTASRPSKGQDARHDQGKKKAKLISGQKSMSDANKNEERPSPTNPRHTDTVGPTPLEVLGESKFSPLQSSKSNSGSRLKLFSPLEPVVGFPGDVDYRQQATDKSGTSSLSMSYPLPGERENSVSRSIPKADKKKKKTKKTQSSKTWKTKKPSKKEVGSKDSGSIDYSQGRRSRGFRSVNSNSVNDSRVSHSTTSSHSGNFPFAFPPRNLGIHLCQFKFGESQTGSNIADLKSPLQRSTATSVVTTNAREEASVTNEAYLETTFLPIDSIASPNSISDASFLDLRTVSPDIFDEVPLVGGEDAFMESVHLETDYALDEFSCSEISFNQHTSSPCATVVEPTSELSVTAPPPVESTTPLEAFPRDVVDVEAPWLPLDDVIFDMMNCSTADLQLDSVGPS